MDPFIELIRLLRPAATLWRRIDGSGRWGVLFRKRDDLLFCWVVSGECLLVRPHLAALVLVAGDFVLIRTSTWFTLTSDATAKPEESETAFATPDMLALRLSGDGDARPVKLQGGRFLFDTANEEMLTGLLPQVVHVRAADAAMQRIHTLLDMNATESAEPRPGSDFVVARLMELILIELLRSESLRAEQQTPGMLAGLGDAVAAPALRALHANVAHGWTVAELARLAGVSRSAFADRFRQVVGKGPIEYLLDWRMARAKDELRQGVRRTAEIAFLVGFQSASAFSTAFSRKVGCSPKVFAAQKEKAHP